MNQLLYPRLTLTREVEDYSGRATRKQYDGICAVCGVGFTGRQEKKYCSDCCKDKASYLRSNQVAGREEVVS